jgi:peptidoglycan/LPS O-acetylase OafA/YrhL
LLPDVHLAYLWFPLASACNPALWSLCLQTLGSLIVIHLIRARQISPILWGGLAAAAGACLATTPLAAMLAGHITAAVRPSRVANVPLSFMLPALGLCAYLCLVPFAYLPPAMAAFCSGPYLALTACGNAAHLSKIAGVVLLFVISTVTPRFQHLLSALPIGLLGRLSLPIYLVHVPVIASVAAAVLLVPAISAGPGRTAMIAMITVAAMAVAVAAFRPINAFALRAGHSIASGQRKARGAD